VLMMMEMIMGFLLLFIFWLVRITPGFSAPVKIAPTSPL